MEESGYLRDAGKYLREYKVLKPGQNLFYEACLLLILFDEHQNRYTRDVDFLKLKVTVFQK